MNNSSEHLIKLIKLALEEDLPNGDITSDLTIETGTKARASLIANQELCLCGTLLPETIFKCLNEEAQISFNFHDGQIVSKGQIIGSIKSNAKALLKAERTILNFLQKLSGISTYTYNAVKNAPGLSLLDTRKTTPGWRELEKYAVRVAGGNNHRMNLSDMLLVKDNHINANKGDIEQTINKAMKKPSDLKIQVEVRDLAEFKKALQFKLDYIMLDNFSLSEIRSALDIAKSSEQKPIIEISGGVTPDDFQKLKEIGVTRLSSSSFMTKSTWVDISFDLLIEI